MRLFVISDVTINMPLLAELAVPSVLWHCQTGAGDPTIGHHMKHILSTTVFALSASFSLLAADTEEGFVSIFNGKTFDGWKTATEHSNTWKIEDGALTTHGDRCHLFYVGDSKPFKNFELKADVMTEPGSNGGIYFHTKYQESGWPKFGFETQVNNTHTDWKKTGSLYDIINVRESPAQDNKWWTQHIIVQGNHVTIKIDGKTVMDYTEPADKKAGTDFTRKLDEGTFALQAHDPKSVVRYKNIRVKRIE